MDLKFIFYLVLSISSIHVDATTVNRICFIPEITNSDDMNMLELSLVISSYLNDTESVESTLNNHLLFIYKLDTNLECLLTFYMEKIVNFGKLVEQTINTTPKSTCYFLGFLMNIISLCSKLQRQEYASFHRDVDQLMSEYENLINMSTYTKKAVKKTYLLEHFTACDCKEIRFKVDYYNILACSNIFLMHQNTLSHVFVNNFEKLDQISTNRVAKDLCIELVIDEAHLLNIIYDFEYKKLFAGTLKLRNAARAPNSTFDGYLESMFPELTTSNRFTNIVYMAWTDIDEKIDFYIRHAKHNVLRDCSKQCFMERLTIIKNRLNTVLLDKKHPLNSQDKSKAFMHFVCERIKVF